MAASEHWPLSRTLILILAAAFFGLVVDLRVEHVDVVRETALAWTPIIYSSAMTLACLLAVALWGKFMRLLMMLLFLLAFIVGGLGLYFHNSGRYGKLLTNPISAWTDPKMKRPHGPPQNAPMTFAGLGLLGFLACLKRHNEPR